MYLPKHFRADERETRELLEGIRVADLITPTDAGLFATFLPLLYESPGDSPGGGPGDSSGGAELGSLLGHVARKNDHWRLQPNGESLVIVHGPDAYISPGWYASKREHGRVVPTWNYLTAHIHGELLVHDDPRWLEALVRRLTSRHEAAQPQPWSVDDAPRDYVDAQLKAIVGLELRITRVQAKAKLGQNRPTADIDGTIAGLRAGGDQELAAATDRSRRDL
ncbi:MAG: FMN-binding negative transcriptional regulator [Acidobacteriota bacterium]|nr:FMN-binding negative transcriptional regulator [Acidobacteriota bacterium]